MALNILSYMTISLVHIYCQIFLRQKLTQTSYVVIDNLTITKNKQNNLGSKENLEYVS